MQNSLYTPCLHVDLAFQIQSIALLSGPFVPHKQALQTHLSEVHEVLEAGVEVRLLAQAAHVLEVRVVDVRVHSEQALEDDLDHVHEVRREVHAVLLREDRRVVQLRHDDFALGH